MRASAALLGLKTNQNLVLFILCTAGAGKGKKEVCAHIQVRKEDIRRSNYRTWR